MENERLTFEQVCEQYEFAAWELAELVGRGDIHTEVEEGMQWFEPEEIMRFFYATPYHFFSLDVAGRICGKSASNLKQQAGKGALQAKKISKRWAVNAEKLDEYIRNYARGLTDTDY